MSASVVREQLHLVVREVDASLAGLARESDASGGVRMKASSFHRCIDSSATFFAGESPFHGLGAVWFSVPDPEASSCLRRVALDRPHGYLFLFHQPGTMRLNLNRSPMHPDTFVRQRRQAELHFSTSLSRSLRRTSLTVRQIATPSSVRSHPRLFRPSLE